MNDTRRPIVFYVSGHGFGHARRMTQVIKELSALRPDVAIHIRSAAPPRVFEPIAADRVKSSSIDSGMVEADALAIDRQATLLHLEKFMDQADAIVAAEIRQLQSLKPSLIVADIPFLAGEIAAAIGVPCIGISNFTWDWIYRDLFGDDPRFESIHSRIISSYAKFDRLLRLPFGRTCSAIKNTIDVPLIAPKTSRSVGEILTQIGVSQEDSRPRVLFATRGGFPPEALANAALQSPEYLFLCALAMPESPPKNLKTIALARDLDFSDVLSVCDIVVSKLGYGIVAECIAAKVRLVWPRRSGFAEDAITEVELPKYVPTVEISHDEYRSGSWRAALQSVLKSPMPGGVMAVDGAARCAENLVSV